MVSYYIYFFVISLFIQKVNTVKILDLLMIPATRTLVVIPLVNLHLVVGSIHHNITTSVGSMELATKT